MSESSLDLPPELVGVTPDDKSLGRQLNSSLNTLLDLQRTFNDPEVSEEDREEVRDLFRALKEQLYEEGFIKSPK